MFVLAWSIVVVVAAFSVNPSQGFSYSVNTFRVPVDHFSFSRNDSFHIRYLLNATFWDVKRGPIFFYTGNEGNIELFANNTGFMWEIAPSFKALVVFAEHRYYGASLPFGNKSFSNAENAGYLTSQQALADYVDLISHLRSNQTEKEKSPVFAFGGSYGGMLAAYMRMKYPHVVQGAIAASAPIWQFTGMTPCNAFYRIATSAYFVENRNCSKAITKSWNELNKLASQDSDLQWLTNEWRLCRPLAAKDLPGLKGWLRDAYINLAMGNYPYPADFLAELPGHPVREACKSLRNGSSFGKELLKDLFSGISVYFNHTGKAKCLNWADGGEQSNLDSAGWSYQSCTEMVMPLCSDGVNDMFERSPWDENQFSEDCRKKWKVRPQPRLAEKIYGGKRIGAATNIIFSNGLLDPWSSGGVLKTDAEGISVFLIPEGAHHLDLRESNEADPISVRQARIAYRKAISEWIDRYKRSRNEGSEHGQE